MIAMGMPRTTRHTIVVDGTFEDAGLSINYQQRITFEHHPAEPRTRFEPGVDESFGVIAVAISMRDGVWIELTAGEYSDDGVIDTIIDWRYREEMDAQLYRTELAA